MDDVKTGLCEFCRELKPITWIDSVNREYCADCLNQLMVLFNPMRDYLMATIPFKVGDRVECRTAGALFDGVGTIDEISIDPAKFGTPVWPSFRVTITEKAYPEAPDSLFYTETCLRKVTDKADT